MKKLLLVTFGILISSMSCFAQSANNYTFTAVQGNYIPLTGVPGVTDTSIPATADDGVSTPINLPFAFTFAGTAYSSIQVSANGWLSFATGTLTDSNDNTQVNAEAKKPILFPLWDNLKCNVKPRYIVTGIAPHRRFKVEWIQQSWNNVAAGDVISFQVWLFESTNVVEFLYSQGAVAVSNTSGGASIGILDAANRFLTLNNSGGTPTEQTDVFTTNISTKPATGQIYRFSPPTAVGLEANNYCFSPSSRTYNTLTGTNVPTLGSSADDVTSAAIPLPFSFNFGGSDYSNVRVSSNGWLSFASAFTISAAQNYTNTAANANLIRPVLMPLWDDLVCTSIPKYTTSGTAPNRIFKVEWSGQRWSYGAFGAVISFQVWLYEKTNVIEYIYDRDFWNVSNGLATIGIYDANGRYLTLNNPSASPAASSSDFTFNIAAKPAIGQVYKFTPPPIISYPGNAFIATGKVAVTQTGVSGGTYSAIPVGLSLNSTTGEVDLTASTGGTYTITYSTAGCTSATTEMTIFSLLPQPTANVTVASCAAGNDGAITITNMNHAVRFTAANNHFIDLGSTMLSGRSAFTIAGWIKFRIADITGRTSLFGQNNAIEFGFANSTTIECYTVATGAVTAALPASLGNDQWHHISVTGDGTHIRIYIDGVSVPVTGGVVNTSNYGTSAFSTKIGGRVFNDTTGETFTGDILKAVFFSTALPASRIASLAFGPTTYSGFESGIIAGYNFYDGAGTTLTSIPAGYNGTFTNSPLPQWIDPYAYVWQRVSDGSTVASTKNLTGLTPGDYRVTVSLIGVSSPNAKIFSVGSEAAVFATAGTGANCTTTINANWNFVTGTTNYLLDVATDAAFTNFLPGFTNLNVGNVLTYPVTNVPPGPIYYRVRRNTSCGVSANSNVIQYQTLQVKSPVATDVTNLLCNGFTANWTAVPGATAYYLEVATDPGFTAPSILGSYNNINVGNVTSRVVTGLTSGSTYYYRLRSANGNCGAVAVPSNTISILINVGPTTPVVGTITQATCARPLGSVVLSGLPAGDWVLRFLTGETYSGKGSSVTISDLEPGKTYNASVTSDVCFSGYSANIPISSLVIPTSTWNGSTWSIDPNINNYVVFEGNYTSTGDISGCTCTVNSGVNVTVNSGHTFTITNAVTTTGGTLTFENNASLVQTNDVSNTGNIIYKRITQPMKNFDYTYWSSPIASQALNILSPNTLSDKYFSYNSNVTNWKQETPPTRMMVGKGYIIRTPKAGTWGNGEAVSFPYSQPVRFVGIPNNGKIIGEEITSLTSTRNFLIGNPYPSALDADLFLSANTAILQGTIYLWTHNTGISQSGSKYVYSPGDYASYNTTGGTGTTSRAFNPGNNTATPTGKIAAGQSFFARAKASGTVVFTNAMRIPGNNNQFFKPGKTSKTSGLEKHRLWLDLNNNDGAFKQTLIGYIEGATNDYEDNFDGISFDGNPYVDFYSINNENKLVIQGRELPFNNKDIIPLGYKSTIVGSFTIGINQTDGLLDNQAIYLEDKVTQTIHDLKSGNYTFTTQTGTFNDRFVLRYTNNALGTDDFDNYENGVLVTVLNKIITVSSSNEILERVLIYDISGKQVFRKNNIDNPKHVIDNLRLGDQVLLVKVILKNGTSTTRKIIF